RHRERREERVDQPARTAPRTDDAHREELVREEQRQEALRREAAAAAEAAARETEVRETEVRETEPDPVQTVAAVPGPTPRPAETLTQIEEPKVDPQEYLSSAGLVMIETDRSKAPTVQSEPETPQLGRPRRERPQSPPPAQDEELVQIETRK